MTIYDKVIAQSSFEGVFNRINYRSNCESKIKIIIQNLFKLRFNVLNYIPKNIKV